VPTFLLTHNRPSVTVAPTESDFRSLTLFGPLWLGVPWVSILLVGILAALLLAALTPRPRGQALPQTGVETQTLVALDVFFWVLIAGLAIAITARYIVH